MKKFLLVLGVVLAGSLRASAPHPSVLTVKYRDQMLPVVKVIGTDPVVMVDGAEKRIRTEPSYLVQRADGYGPGRVTARHVTAAGTELKIVASQDELQDGPGYGSSGPRFGTSYFEGRFTSRETLSGGFVVIVFYSPLTLGFSSNEMSLTEVVVHDLPVLPAGQEVDVKLSAAIPNGQPNLTFFFQIFDGHGREIVTNAMEPAWKYYAQRDRLKLVGVRTQYLEKFRGADHAAVPAVMARPVFREGVKTPQGEASALITVSADGVVTQVEVRGVEDTAARDDIANALGGWLFLPQLKGGVPVATKLQVPLEF